MISCVCPALVRDEKLILIGIYLKITQETVKKGIFTELKTGDILTFLLAIPQDSC
jgi:hypothetical protein